MTRRLIIATDLDGTLLDHVTYRFEPALPVIADLERRGIPWLLNSSKTLAEMVPLRTRLGHAHPFAVENGAAVYIPPRYFAHGAHCCHDDSPRVVAFGPTRDWICEQLWPLATRYAFQGFGDLSARDVGDLTGLGPEAAARAQQRQYSEPLLWRDTAEALSEFRQDLAKRGLTLTRGGRFFHVSGRCDKGTALRWLLEAYQAYRGWQCSVLALGDGENDAPMLEVADYAVIVRSPANPPPNVVHTQSVPITDQCGPQGWAQAVESFVHAWTTGRG